MGRKQIRREDQQRQQQEGDAERLGLLCPRSVRRGAGRPNFQATYHALLHEAIVAGKCPAHISTADLRRVWTVTIWSSQRWEHSLPRDPEDHARALHVAGHDGSWDALPETTGRPPAVRSEHCARRAGSSR